MIAVLMLAAVLITQGCSFRDEIPCEEQYSEALQNALEAPAFDKIVLSDFGPCPNFFNKSAIVLRDSLNLEFTRSVLEDFCLASASSSEDSIRVFTIRKNQKIQLGDSAMGRQFLERILEIDGDSLWYALEMGGLQPNSEDGKATAIQYFEVAYAYCTARPVNFECNGILWNIAVLSESIQDFQRMRSALNMIDKEYIDRQNYRNIYDDMMTE